MAKGRPGRRPAKLHWLKLNIDGWLDGTTREELEPDERGTFLDIVAHAGRANDHGKVRASVQSLPRLLNITPELLNRTLKKCVEAGKIKVNGDAISVVNFDKYNPERWERDYYREGDDTGENVDNVEHSAKGPKTKKKIKTKKKSKRTDRSHSVDNVEHSAKSTETPITFSQEEGQFLGISPAFLAKWQKAYKLLDVGVEVAKAEAWVMANPDREKKNWGRFLVNWLGKAQQWAEGRKEERGAKDGPPLPPVEERAAQAREDKKREEQQRAAHPPKPASKEVRDRIAALGGKKRRSSPDTPEPLGDVIDRMGLQAKGDSE